MHEQVNNTLCARCEMGSARRERIAGRAAGCLGQCKRCIMVQHPTGRQRAETTATAGEKLAACDRRTAFVGWQILVPHAKLRQIS
jgi:hypothetical protein